MTERDAIKTVVEKSITLTTEIEPLRAWCKERYEKAHIWEMKGDVGKAGEACAYFEMIMKLDELEVSNGTSSSN